MQEGTERQLAGAPYPAPLLRAMLNAAEDAAAISDGLKAFEYLSETLDHASARVDVARDRTEPRNRVHAVQ